MYALRAYALATTDAAFLTRRTRRQERRHRNSERLLRSLLRAMRRALSGASDQPADAWLPRITRSYPY